MPGLVTPGARRALAYLISLAVALAVAALFGFVALWIWDSTVETGPTAATLGGAKVFILAGLGGFVVGGLLVGIGPAQWQRLRRRDLAVVFGPAQECFPQFRFEPDRLDACGCRA